MIHPAPLPVLDDLDERAEFDELDSGRAVYEPTPEEIARECACIRAGWSAHELRQRAAMRPRPWTPPRVAMPFELAEVPDSDA